MSRLPIAFALAVGLALGALATQAAAQGTAPACTQPFDPACNHLKCYQIKDKASTVISKSPILQLDNQFGREMVFRLQPVLLCVPTQKSCCCPGSPGCIPGASGCSTSNCRPNPVTAPALPHFKCYKIKAKLCTDATCPQGITKATQVNLADQFGQELNVPVGSPRLICAPATKAVVGVSTTTATTTSTTSTTSTTTTTLQICHFDSASPTGCTGPCPPTFPPGSQCQLTAPNHCDCKPPPVCCACTGTAGMGCFNTNGVCPTGCAAVADAQCNPTTRGCDCGNCRSSAGCIVPAIPCDANNPCPQGAICDPIQCPRPCAGPCDQPTGQCNPDPCFRSDGTVAHCMPSPLKPCSCCGLTGTSCTTDFDCCSGVCNPPSCQ